MTKKERVSKGIGFIPIFNDYKVYSGMRLVATLRKTRIQSLILEITANYYNEVVGSPLAIDNPVTFHKQLSEASKKLSLNGIIGFIETACAKFIIKELDKYKPRDTH